MISDEYKHLLDDPTTAAAAVAIVKSYLSAGIPASQAIATFSLIIAMMVGGYCDVKGLALEPQLRDVAETIVKMASMVNETVAADNGTIVH